jgi:hypothetical protein
MRFRANRDERRECGSPRQWRRYRSHHEGKQTSDQTTRDLLTGIRQRALKTLFAACKYAPDDEESM